MLLLIDKPSGITSHDVVDRVRRITGERRVGHGGTLDPMATGLLIVGVGRESTKKLGDITKGMGKTYIAEITLGATSTTDDAEGTLTLGKSTAVSEEEIKEILKSFLGEQKQVPPQFSAIKMKGKKAYELARAGKSVVMEARVVTIYSINLLSFVYPKLTIECEVSAGTYIRSLARDLGEKLGTGAYLSALRRTRIGNYNIKDAKKLDQLK